VQAELWPCDDEARISLLAHEGSMWRCRLRRLTRGGMGIWISKQLSCLERCLVNVCTLHEEEYSIAGACSLTGPRQTVEPVVLARRRTEASSRLLLSQLFWWRSWFGCSCCWTRTWTHLLHNYLLGSGACGEREISIMAVGEDAYCTVCEVQWARDAMVGFADWCE